MASRGVTFAAFVLMTSATILSVMYFQPGAIVCLNPPLDRRGGPIQTSQEVKDTELLILKPAGTQEDIGGGPLRFVRQKGHVDDLPSLDLTKLTTEQLRMTMHSYLDNTDVLCRRKFRMGNIGDGGWEVCDDPDVRPREPCIIYSFGTNNDFSFDDDAAKMYGCHVYSFDPSMTNEKEEFNRSSNVHFYRLGLDGQTHVNANKWALLTLHDIKTTLGHRSHAIDVVKMDIETSEWPALPEMVGSGAMDSVRQFLIEYHVDGQDSGYLLPRLTAIQSLERAGFRKFYSHKNLGCKVAVNGFPLVRTTCYELHYLKRKT